MFGGLAVILSFTFLFFFITLAALYWLHCKRCPNCSTFLLFYKKISLIQRWIFTFSYSGFQRDLISVISSFRIMTKSSCVFYDSEVTLIRCNLIKRFVNFYKSLKMIFWFIAVKKNNISVWVFHEWVEKIILCHSWIIMVRKSVLIVWLLYKV